MDGWMHTCTGGPTYAMKVTGPHLTTSFLRCMHCCRVFLGALHVRLQRRVRIYFHHVACKHSHDAACFCFPQSERRSRRQRVGTQTLVLSSCLRWSVKASNVCMSVCMCVCMHARMYVCMYVCMYVRTRASAHTHTSVCPVKASHGVVELGHGETRMT